MFLKILKKAEREFSECNSNDDLFSLTSYSSEYLSEFAT